MIFGKYKINVSGIGSIKKDEGFIFDKSINYTIEEKEFKRTVYEFKINTRGKSLKEYLNFCHKEKKGELLDLLKYYTISNFDMPELILNKTTFNSNDIYSKLMIIWLKNNNFITKTKSINSITFENNFKITFHYEPII